MHSINQSIDKIFWICFIFFLHVQQQKIVCVFKNIYVCIKGKKKKRMKEIKCYKKKLCNKKSSLSNLSKNRFAQSSKYPQVWDLYKWENKWWVHSNWVFDFVLLSFFMFGFSFFLLDFCLDVLKSTGQVKAELNFNTFFIFLFFCSILFKPKLRNASESV